ncbi:hypothetical protein GRI62_05810 [Erythrobacter arachoides]|uniref:Pilus assembly protein n=1 Tax=Aurantiacibacter arachoides TaxID=1850444 RepID=A0A844ZXV2_9SPHN|nr:hypothetical protein [Aurantiacibacter arachoides]MXO93121.1 hypothetical protein [Aurantiacibacter arachoides]GGD51874.1 hypothetical protein GCM10011411_09640 [Aurantiacibacter arachoides]
MIMRSIRRLLRSDTGLAMTEFALSLPLLLVLGLTGLETANRALVQMQVSQLAVQIADNASRIGETSVLEDRKIYEFDINDLFYGAHLQGGRGIGLLEHGRVILSSQEVAPGTDDDQYIHWQRCMGRKQFTSSYGEEGAGLGGSAFAGMGPSGEEVLAFEDGAVMFVEIAYDYQPLFGEPFGLGDQVVGAVASFTVRTDRDLTQIYQLDDSNPDPVARCDTYGGSSYADGAS